MNEWFPDAKDEAAPWLRPKLAASWREIATVLFLVTGLFAGTSAWAATHGSSHRYFNLFLNDRRLLDNLALESALLGLLLLYLHRRGWAPADLKIIPGWLSSLAGIPLMIAMSIGNTVTVFGLNFAIFLAQKEQYNTFQKFLVVNGQHLRPHSIHVSWVVMIVAVAFNAFFEEITCMAYMFNQFAAKRGPLFALLLTVLIRMAYHTYEGPIHMLGIGMVFLVLGLYYWWSRNLWAAIIAHAFIDLISFAALKTFFS